MRSMNKAFLAIVVVTLLTACASADGPPFILKPAVQDKVTIYAFRTASIVGGGNSDIVAVNGRFIGRVNSGTYAVYETPPGKIIVSRKGGSIFGSGKNAGWGLGGVVGALEGFLEVANFIGKAKEIYFIRFPHSELVANEKALPMMDGLEDVSEIK